MTKAVQDLMIENERVRDAFRTAVLTDRDLDAATALVADEVELTTVPPGTGVSGRDALRRHLAEAVLPHLPDDLSVRRVSRTTDRWRVAEELLVAFTHDRPLPWLLPDLTPTGRHVEVVTMSVVAVRRSRITSHRTLWDRTGLLGQVSPGSA